MGLEFERLEAPFGVAAYGIDIQRGVSSADFGALVDAIHEHRLLVIKHQNCDKDDYLTFGRRWGEPLEHVLDHLRMPGYPQMLVLGNTEAKDKDDAVRNGAAYWHTDQSYTANPVTFTMLYSRSVPNQGGETLLADMGAAYDALDEVMQRKLDDLVVVHLRGAARLREGEHVTIPFKDAQQAARVSAVKHPLVRVHPVTGKKMLYAVAGTAVAIEGLNPDASNELLEELKKHATSERFSYARKHEVGDIAIFDTLATLHAATQIGVATGPYDSRVIWRISVHGRPVAAERRQIA